MRGREREGDLGGEGVVELRAEDERGEDEAGGGEEKEGDAGERAFSAWLFFHASLEGQSKFTQISILNFFPASLMRGALLHAGQILFVG